MSKLFLTLLVVSCIFIATVAAIAGPAHRQHHKSQHHVAPTPAHQPKHLHNKFPHLNLPVAGSKSEVAHTGAPYNVSGTYVLGLSSGGFLAVQMSVAYSSEFSGAAIFAAGPYYCAQGSLSTAMDQCVDALSPLNLPSLESTTNFLASLNLIDGLGNLTNAPVYLFHGQSDRTVFSTVNEDLYQMYLDFGANVVYNNMTQANHAWVSPTGPNYCTESSSPYISNCGIDVENELLTHLFGQSPVQATSQPTGNVYGFSQDQYAESLYGTSASTYSMDTTGYIYLPKSCAGGAQCSILVVLHGCLQGYSEVGPDLIEYSNLNVYADTNDYIVVYPQAIASPLVENPEGCWDWWGYTTSGSSTLYATHGAPQMEIVRAVVKALGFKGKPKDLEVRRM